MAPFFPEYGQADPSSMGELRKMARRATARASRKSLRKRKATSYLLLRRLAAVLLPGKEKIEIARNLSGKSPLKQFLERMVLFIGYRLDARDYYDYSLFMPDIFIRAGEFQGPSDIALFNSHLNQNETTPITEDKQLFQQFCVTHGIPTPAILAVFDPDHSGKEELADALSSAAARSELFFKPRFGFKGAGVGRLGRDGQDQWSLDFGNGNRTIGIWDEIYDLLRSTGEPLVFQDILHNHPDLAKINPNTLHTLRITTFSDGVDIHVFSAVLRIGLGDSTTDNVSIGGLGAPVEIETGRLLDGTQERIDVLPLSIRYAGDDKIELQSVQIPYFGEALEMARTLHAALPEMFSLGHDIAILTNGPVAVETNHIWGDFQKFHNLGHGADRTYISNLISRCREHPDFS